MILYRARSLSSRPGRLPVFDGNEPYNRVRGRWFTSSRDFAMGFGIATFAPGKWELISIDVPDAIVDSFRVETTPHTQCGLSPIDYADRPGIEYIVPMFRVMDAVEVTLPAAANDTGRKRDYIHVDEISTPRAKAA